MPQQQYIVVENAGYNGERDVHACGNYFAALRWLDRNYGEEEQREMNVAVCAEINGERSYDC